MKLDKPQHAAHFYNSVPAFFFPIKRGVNYKDVVKLDGF